MTFPSDPIDPMDWQLWFFNVPVLPAGPDEPHKGRVIPLHLLDHPRERVRYHGVVLIDIMALSVAGAYERLCQTFRPGDTRPIADWKAVACCFAPVRKKPNQEVTP
jgi:hypothetical protein